MKRLLTLLVFLISLPIISFATHNLGGYISYKHLSGLTYEITVTTYTDLSVGVADRCELILHFGDGTSEAVQRTNGPACSGINVCTHCGVVVANEYKLNEYVVNHTFPSNNTYVVYMEDPNRTAGIVNLENSISTPFSIQSEINVNSASINSSPKIIASPNIQASILDTVSLNLTAYDEDGDVLTYELVTPTGSNSLPVSGYTLPNTVSIDPINGEFLWTDPVINGNYVFAVKISECRNGVSLGHVTVEFTIGLNMTQSVGEFINTQTWQKDYLGRYVINVSPNDTVDLNIEFQNLQLGSYPIEEIEGYSEVFSPGNNASFSFLNRIETAVSYSFHWVPVTQDLRCSPYVLTFRGESNYASYGSHSRDITVMIFVKDQSTTNCSSVCGGVLSVESNLSEDDLSVSFAPNPIQTESVVRINSPKGNENFYFTVYDLLGKKIHETQVLNQPEFTFNRGNLRSGLYIYKLSDGVTVLDQGKIVLVD